MDRQILLQKDPFYLPLRLFGRAFEFLVDSVSILGSEGISTDETKDMEIIICCSEEKISSLPKIREN